MLESVRQSFTHSINQSVSQSISQSSQSLNQSISHPLSRSDNQSVSQPVQSVSQSVRLGFEPLRDSWPDFGCSECSCDFICGGAYSLSRRRVCHVTGHSPCLCQATRTFWVVFYRRYFYFCLYFFLPSFSFYLLFPLNTVRLCTHQASQPTFCTADYA